MPNSMTGFGRVEISQSNWQVNVEIKTVNHRYSDIAIKMPKNLSALEAPLRRLISARIARGRVDLYINMTSLGERPYTPRINWGLVNSYLEAAREMGVRFDLDHELDSAYLLSLPDVVNIEEPRVDEGEIWNLVQPAVEQVLSQVVQMRRDEGARLVEDINFRVDKIAESVVRIEARSPVVVQEYSARLTERMNGFLQDGLLEPERIAAEAAVFADKSSITEEIIRLQSHLVETRKLVQESEPIGRKLDFIVQEMNREINTIASKANDDQIAGEAIFCKAEIEKIREQAQNLE